MKTFNPACLHLYFVAGSQDFAGDEARLLTCLEAALKAGITAFQLREKNNPSGILSLAKACQTLCRAHDVPFWIDDDVALGMAIGADGIHIGQTDMPLEEALYTVKDNHLGLSVHTLAEAETALVTLAKVAAATGKAPESLPLCYFGVGPIFATKTKADAKSPVGVARLQALKAAGIALPLVGIGGINAERAQAVRETGAGVAVVTAITAAQDVEAAVAALL